MTALQLGFLQWMAAFIILLLGIGFGRWIQRGKVIEQMVLALEAERLERLERETDSREREQCGV